MKLKTYMDNDEIQRKADRLLQETLEEVIDSEVYKIVPYDFNTQTDRGIDFVFEIIDRQSNQTILKFNVQNKGTENLKNLILKTNRSYSAGHISFKIEELRHISYWVDEINEPVIIFLCDIVKKEIYWYPIQLDIDITERTTTQQKIGRDSIQVYFSPENKLENENHLKFIDDIKQSKIEQNVKYNSKEFDSSYTSHTFNRNTDGDIIEQFHQSLLIFENFPLVPTYLIARQYPVSISKDKKGYVSSSTLYSTNSELISRLASIGDDLKKGVEISKKEREVFQYLNRNFIYHIENAGGEKRERICIHDLVENDETCNCVKCQYSRSEYSAVIGKLFNSNEGVSVREVAKKVYVFYKLGLYENALVTIDFLITKLNKEKKWGLKYVMTYNAKILTRLTYDEQLTDNGKQLRRKFESISLDAEFEKTKSLVSADMYLLIRWIHDESYIYRSLLSIQRSELDQGVAGLVIPKNLNCY